MDTVIFNVRCPHCSKPLQAEVTGFCRTGLNSRWKQCKHCGKDYSVVFIAETTKDREHTDLFVLSLRDKLKYLKVKKMQEKLELEKEIDGIIRGTL